jgi:gluconolactonase
MSELQFRCLLKNIKGSEGPCTTADGRIFMVHPPAGEVLEIVAETARVVANTGGKPAGLQLAPDGRIWISDMSLGILSTDFEGNLRDEVREFEGAPIRGCNDLYFDSKGALYFTAPAGSNATTPEGELFVRRPDGTVHRIDNDYRFCNGLAVSADDRQLIVAETFTKQLHSYEISPDGEIGNRKIWATLPGDHRVGPDGIDFDEDGNLIATNYGAGELDVFDPSGTLLKRIALPFDKPSNIHFLGPDSTELLVTEHAEQGLWVFDYGSRGQRQYGWS